jgi:iron complex outermembrane receptor protein
MLAGFAQQPQAVVRVEVRSDGGPVAGAEVVLGGSSARTDERGLAALDTGPGNVEIKVTKPGFLPASASLVVEGPETVEMVVELHAQEAREEQVTVSATRTNRRLEDVPTRVEVLDREDVEEKMMMTPGDIVMMLNEMGGLRVQATSPSLGAASIRIQGMSGRYTRFLSDGLPLYGQQVGGLGLLQIPPMDLGQVEVIKGVASALYGSGAMGGVVNLISRRPGKEPVHEALVNRSTNGATDGVVFLAAPISRQWSGSLLGGGHFQEKTDVDGDGWADLAGYNRGIVRPRVFWDGGEGRSAFLTAGVTVENREGGTMPGSVLAATGAPYREALDTRSNDLGGSLQFLVKRQYVVTVRAAAAWQRHDHVFGEIRERDHHETVFGEVAVRGAIGKNTWVAGVATEQDRFLPRDVPQFAYRYTTPGVFLQDEVDLRPWVSLSASGRVDFHSRYGTFYSPRLAALFRAKGWTSRLSAGQGFFPPTPLTEETEAAGLARLKIPQPLKPERGRSASWDLTRTLGPGSYTVTVFRSRVRSPQYVARETDYELTNLPEATTNTGVELLATVRPRPFVVTATYTYVRSRETADGRRQDVPLTPRHNVGLVGTWEKENVARVGAEFYYTGRQRLEVNPYGTESRPYVIVGMLVERRFGRFRLFLNAENLTGVRQTRWDPLLRPSRSVDGRWTVDAWAPLYGRVFNGGVRLGF